MSMEHFCCQNYFKKQSGDDLQLHLGQKLLHIGLPGKQGTLLPYRAGRAGHGVAEHIGGVQALPESIAHTGHHGIAGAGQALGLHRNGFRDVYKRQSGNSW